MTGRAGAHAPWESLSTVRKAAGVSLASLAQASKLNISHLSALEKGRVSPRATTLKRIADALGVPVTSIPVPEGTDWIAQRVAELVAAELERVGLSGLADEPKDAEVNEDLAEALRAMMRRDALSRLVSIRNGNTLRAEEVGEAAELLERASAALRLEQYRLLE